jgi:hypothetical protein
MKLSLTVSERVAALGIFNNPENKVATENLKAYLEDVHKFRITDEDKELCDWKEVTSEDDGKTVTNYTWNNEKAGEKEIELDSFTHSFLKDKLKSLEYSAADPLAGAIATLASKM